MNVIAYGSLMSQPSLELTLKRPAQLIKISVPNWKRVFNAPFDGYAFLNLQAEPSCTIEAAYFKLKPAEAKLFAEREAGSSLVEVMPRFFGFVWPDECCQKLPVLQSYIDVCRRGASELGLNFSSGLDWPTMVIDDSENPVYR